MELGTPDTLQAYVVTWTERGNAVRRHILAQIRHDEENGEVRTVANAYERREQLIDEARELLEDIPWIRSDTMLPREGFGGVVTVLYALNGHRHWHTFRALHAREIYIQTAHIPWETVSRIVDMRQNGTLQYEPIRDFTEIRAFRPA